MISLSDATRSRLRRNADRIALALLVVGVGTAVFPLRRYGLIRDT